MPFSVYFLVSLFCIGNPMKKVVMAGLFVISGIMNSIAAEPVNGAGGDWVCKAGGPLAGYVYPFGGFDYQKAIIHLAKYSMPNPFYWVTKVDENKVKGATGDGTPFECTKNVSKKK